MKKKFFKVLTKEKALSLFDNIPIKEKERIKTKDALGRISGNNVVSPCDVPNFDRSTMDGYSVIAEDTFGATETAPILLRVKGEIIMGRETRTMIEKGETIEIPTGGMLPEGADAVVMVEYTKKREGDILVKKPVAPMENVAKRGSDIKKSDILLEIGKRIRAQDIGVLSASGITEIKVYEKPLVSIISTGDELVSPEREPKLGEIRGINTFTLNVLTKRYGGEPVDLGIVKDSMSELRKQIKDGLFRSDIVVISGGSSVGTKDITLDCISSFDKSEILANGLALKPGKPTILAIIADKPVIGLPGHPVSCMVIFYLIVRPLILRMLFHKEDFEDKISISSRITQRIPSVSGREEYIRVKLVEKNGELWAEPVPGGSSVISSLSKSDGLVRIDLESEGIEKGEEVEVIIM